MRESGYYWVLIGHQEEPSEWKVAEWDGSAWWTCGSDREWAPEDVALYFMRIGERITRDGK